MPNSRQFEKTSRGAVNNVALHHFLDSYHNDDCFYDWGDDPSFFAAQHFLGDVRTASWGVCRPDVRRKVQPGDLIIFFCVQQRDGGQRRYYYIGFGTVGELVLPRIHVWRKERFRPYREFFNVLIDTEDEQSEYFYDKHSDYRKRSEAPYVIFNSGDRLTHFNVVNPLLVATYKSDARPPEQWRTHVATASELHDLLFDQLGITRGLRTSPRGNAHPKINIGKECEYDPQVLGALREKLWRLSMRVQIGHVSSPLSTGSR